MAERSLVDRVMREQEEVGPFSAQLLLAEVVEDQGRRLAVLEQIILRGGPVPARVAKGALP